MIRIHLVKCYIFSDFLRVVESFFIRVSSRQRIRLIVMIEINTPHYLERRTKRLFAFELQIVKTISGSFVEMNLTIKDSLKQLVKGSLSITIFAIDNCNAPICRTLNLAMISEISKVFEFYLSYSHFDISRSNSSRMDFTMSFFA